MTRSYSVSVRLRKITLEAAHVSVLLTQDLINDQGTVDADKVMEAAIKMARDLPLHWLPDGEPVIELHPIQIAPA